MKQILKRVTSLIAMTMLVLISCSSHGQIFRKRHSKETADKRSTYAYQTFSTTQPKEKKKGYAGNEAKFRFEKPLTPVPFGEIDRSVDYSKAPYFGHKRPPVRRPVGSMRLCKVCGIRH